MAGRPGQGLWPQRKATNQPGVSPWGAELSPAWGCLALVRWPGGQVAVALTLQPVQLARAVLPCDVLPVGAARQGHHGAQRGGALTHLHLELGQREEGEGQRAREGQPATRGRWRPGAPATRAVRSLSLRTWVTAQTRGLLGNDEPEEGGRTAAKEEPFTLSLRPSKRQTTASRATPSQLLR